MTKEELLRLRTNAIRHENKTGYPHLDLAHLQFYSEAALDNYDIPDISMYGLLYERIVKENFQDLIAMEYFGRKITYRDFLAAINDYASAFLNIGIRKGDVVSIASPNLPEVFYSIYALNKIGAVANLIDPRNNLDRIKQFISQSHSETLIMLDIVYPKISKIIDDTPVKRVYTIAAADSLPTGLGCLQRVKTRVESRRSKLPVCPKSGIYYPLVKMVAEKRDPSRTETPLEQITKASVKDDVAVIINTSGTTGSPKGVMLTNENFNAIAYSYINVGADIEPGDTLLGIMPNFLAYGIGFGTHMLFIQGIKHILIPTFKPEEFPKLVLKHKPAHFAGVPNFFQYLITDKKVQKADLSFIKYACAGGDSMDPNFKKKCSDFLLAHGSKYKVLVGYGLTENAGMTAAQVYIGESTEKNELYTVGIPTLYSTFYVADPETGEFLKTNQPGELIISGKSVMKGYVDNPEETNKVIEEKDGVRYLHTGDIGYVDDEGMVYVIDRIKRIIIRPDGHNVFPAYIENVVTKHPDVKECVCVGVKKAAFSNGKIPVAFLVLEDGHKGEADGIIKELKEMSLRELPERDVALDYIVIDKLPMTDAGKVDYRALEKEATEL